MTTDHAIMVKRLARAPIEAQSFEMCDHSGYLPLLVRNGFAGRIFCTPATRHLCKILLRDSGHLQEKEVEYANQHGFSKHRAALPLYTQDDAERSLGHFTDIDFGRDHEIASGLIVKFRRAGHILGAATAEVRVRDVRLLFSGEERPLPMKTYTSLAARRRSAARHCFRMPSAARGTT